MNYKELIKSYQSKGFGTEKKMWESIYALEDAMNCLKEKSPDAYDKAMRDLHEVFFGPHYNECLPVKTWQRCTIKIRRVKWSRVNTGTWSRWQVL